MTEHQNPASIARLTQVADAATPGAGLRAKGTPADRARRTAPVRAADDGATFWQRFLPRILVAAALLPAAYVFAAVQYSGLTYPFWDNTDLVRWLVDMYGGHLRLTSLWAPHNHSRPLTLRVIYLINARMTNWDIRSEFVYMYAAIYGTFALHMVILWRSAGRRLTTAFGAGLLLLSIVYFSPAGHMNHWWSMMLQLNLANLLIVYSLYRLARSPHSAPAALVAAATAWLATYTLTNGLVAMLVLAIVAQISRARPLRPDWWTLFWAANVVVLFTVYLHGLPHEPGGRPGPVDLAKFSLLYLGAPIADLIHYPFKSNFDVPTSTWLATVCGIVVTSTVVTLSISARHRIRAAEPTALLLLAFTLFALGSAVLTAWGRAELDASGVAQALTSRYTIFGAFPLYAIIHYVGAAAARGEWRSLLPRISASLPARAAAAAATLVIAAAIGLGAVAYADGAHSYRGARAFNDGLHAAYALRPEARKLDGWVYANPVRAEEVKADMLLFHIGPYRGVDRTDAILPAGADGRAPARTVLMTPTTRVYQEFTAEHDRLVMLGARIVSTRRPMTAQPLQWKLFRIGAHGRTTVGGSQVALDGDTSWTRFVVGEIPRSAGRRYGLLLTLPTASSQPLKIALYRRTGAAGSLGQTVVDGRRMRGLTLGLVESTLDD